MKNLLEEAVDAILELQEEHKKKLGLYRFTTPIKETLDIVVNPSILKLTEEYDKAVRKSIEKKTIRACFLDRNLGFIFV
ncbi:hypothetical protein RMCBS344292_19291 [Rhizopus microsporus]|nr:hypothetical protein RMCBS344292_19291 [Rhizopus microsporus]